MPSMLDSLRNKVSRFPKSPGVYVMLDAKKREIYVGKAARLRERVGQYFQDPAKLVTKTRALVSNVRDVKYIETASEVEALVLEARMIKDLQPKYNVRLKSNEQYALVELPWGEDFPKPVVTRERGHRGSKYIGPFVDVKGLRTALKALRRAFPYRTCSRTIRDDDPKRRFVRPCLNYHIRLCTGPCANRATKKAYRAGLARLALFLRGRKDDVLDELRTKMKAASCRREYEAAAELRDSIAAIESLERRGSLTDGIEPAPPTIDPAAAVEKLGDVLGREGPARTVDGIDLANLGGGDAVGSVVTFSDGTPERGGYRHFRIKHADTRDDYDMLREVMRRRYFRLKRERAPVPDVILVDGGPGHLRVAAEELESIRLVGPTLVSISKARDSRTGKKVGARGRDTIRTLKKRRGVEFPRASPAYRLLQFVRDEAHRFAQHYHHIRRRKRVLGEKR
jgi:excinuclease ABC subunit C